MTKACPHSITRGFNNSESSAQMLMNDPGNTDLLHAYFRQTVASGRIAEARRVLDQLQVHRPWNHDIRKLRIALYLQQNDYTGAMNVIETLVAFSTPDKGLIDSSLAVRQKIGPKIIRRNANGGPSLSLCMIVKNEQAFLGPCLNSAKGLVDEIIVIDTGSEDRSADVARIFGAVVHHFQWCDDFAAARNYSLEKARGDWVLILDADEIIATQDNARLRQYVAGKENTPMAFSMQTRNYSNLANTVDWQPNDRSYPQHEAGIGWFPTNKVRLFPRSGGIRFVYPVHELVDPAIRSIGLPISKCPIPIHHYGYLNETKRIAKVRQYFELGYAKLGQLGNDKVALRELAIQAGQLDRWPEAIALWHRFLKISPDDGEAYANIAGAHWQLGRFDQGMAYSHKAIKANPGLKEGYYNLAVNQLLSGAAAEAAETLRQLLTGHRNYLAAEFMLAAALFFDDHHRQAMNLFQALAKKISTRSLSVAMHDLMQKCRKNDAAHFAEKLDRAARQISISVEQETEAQ